MIISLANICENREKTQAKQSENKYSREKKSSTCHCFVLKEHYTSLKMYEANIDTKTRDR